MDHMILLVALAVLAIAATAATLVVTVRDGQRRLPTLTR